MVKIWTMGEIIVEIMRKRVDCDLSCPGDFLGPFPSGAPAIFIDTVSRLGGNAGIIGSVGTDDFGTCVLSRLKEDGVDCSHVQVIENGLTGVAFVTYFSDGERKFIFHLENSAAAEMKAPKNPLNGDLFHVMGCSLTINDNTYSEILKTMEEFLSNGAKISFDPNIRPELLKGKSMKEYIGRIVENSSFLLPGVSELLMIAGEDTVEASVAKLFKNPRHEVIALKRGKHGCSIFTREGSHDFGIYDIPPIDATGAGDCFDASFLLCYLEGRPMDECIKVATAAASLNTAAFGPMEGKVTPSMISNLIEQGPYREL